jgi:glycine cleavage system H protein
MENYPEDLKYHKEHTWVRGDGTIGLTFYAQEQLGEIVFIEVPEAGTNIEAGEPFGEIESRKSVSDLYAPVTGTIKEINSDVADAPETINEDPYGKGWVAIVDINDPGELDNLLSAAEYNELVAGEEDK